MQNKEIAIEDVIKFLNFKKEVNRQDIKNIVVTRAGIPIEVSSEDREEFRFTGLNTMDFIYFKMLSEEEAVENDL